MKNLLIVLCLATILLASPNSVQASDPAPIVDGPTITGPIEKIVPSEPEMKKIPKPPVFNR